MRVIVVGASGRVGSEILRGIAGHRQVTHVVSLTEESTEDSSVEGETLIERRQVDLFDDLSDHFKFADAAVYAGWPVSPLRVGLRDRQIEALINVCQCIGVVGVRVFVYGSSAGVYSSAPLGGRIDEAWPIVASTPSRQLSQLVRAEQAVGLFEDHHPLIRVVGLRTGVIVYPTRDRRATIGTKMLRVMNAAQRRRFVPDFGPYVLQCVHVDDVVSALCLALTESVNGSFNIAADPITSDLMAELFAARKVRLAPQHMRRALTLGSRLPILYGPAEWAELAIRPQVLDTTRAERDLHWTMEYPARSIVAEWIEMLEPVSDHPPPNEDADNFPHTYAETTELDLASLYVQSLAYFGEQVHAISDDQWGTTAGEGLTVWQLVASVALDQYRLALAARGDDIEIVESQLPGDPLGIAPADGWDLAAERGSLAVVRPDGQLQHEVEPLYDRLKKLLPRIIFETVRGGSDLRRVLGLDTPAVPHELAKFTERMGPSEAMKM